MFVTYKFWIEAEDVYQGGAAAGGAKNYCVTMDRLAAQKLYNELKKEFG